MISVGGVTFTVAFGLLLWFTRTERDALQRVPAVVDTVDLSRQATSMRQLQFRADSALATLTVPRRISRRATLAVDSSPDSLLAGDTVPADTVSVPEPSRPATVEDAGTVSAAARATADALTARLTRAQNAPLAASWRALAADPALQQDPRVRALADSLVDAERERNEYDAVGGVDPIYLELSSRVTAIGRAIEQSASQRIATLLRGTEAGAVTALPMGPSAAELAERYAVDSARYTTVLRRRDLAVRTADSVNAILRARRDGALERDSARARAQRRVDALAPPAAMLSASAVAAIGIAVLLALLLEVRAPRLADEREAMTQSRLPLLLTIRQTDAATPDALTSAFSQLVFDLDASWALARTLLLVSDDASLAARTAARIGERLGYEGRSVRIVSARLGTARMRTRTRGRATPTSTQAVLVQPERSLGTAWTGEFFLESVDRAMLTIRSGTVHDLRPALVNRDDDPMVVLVVRLGSTATAWLSQTADDIVRLRGTPALGVVLWSADIDDADPVQFALESALQDALAAAAPTK